METKISNLQIMDQMVKEDNKGIRMSGNICEIKNVTQGTIIGFGIEKVVGDDAMIQFQLGLPGEYMFMCFAVNRKEFEATKSKIQNSTTKKFFIRQFYNTIVKNKLDTALREAFAVFENRIISETQLNEFPELHKKVSEAYYASGGRCQPIEFSSSYTGHFTPTSSRVNANVYVTTGYWLEIIEVKEKPDD